MARKNLRPRLVFADASGDIYDHPHLEMLVRRGDLITPPRPDELIPLPPESEFFLLPGRNALGFDPETGSVEPLEESAVAAFLCPAHTLAGVAAYTTRPGAPVLPLFAYGAVGYAEDKFWVCARKVDNDRRQVFAGVPKSRIAKGAARLLKKYPKNRLMNHLSRCALTYCCPAARNLALGRFEAPLPTARACNARCLGCISLQPEDSGFSAGQQRIAFTPTPEEILEVMEEHAGKEKKPVFSFGQGCEGEPLTQAATIAKAVRLFRKRGGRGTVNVNTNASLPEAVEALAEAGATSIRVSLNSADKALYHAYYRPRDYTFAHVRESVVRAKKAKMFVSLNLLYHPGVSDTESEFEAMAAFVSDTKTDLIQLRNLNLDPELYLDALKRSGAGEAPRLQGVMGLKNFMKRLRRECPGLRFGYFNPYLG